ncbi:GTP-binding protein HflX [Vulgatibacter incomptus]|uniref:GTPase HflX n=1 Tax=Vulgatibacter incomptus TaxID=1391653 RepID=A0A0K1PFH2_9BACT|nr:GTP-binding protein HflX [Vulgatibacter incomptus]
MSPELARHLTEISRETGRQIGVLLTRKGEVEHVIVGDAHKLLLPDVGRARAGQVRLRGLRLVHTHLRGETLTKDDLTDLALLRLDLVCEIQALDNGLPGAAQVAHLLPENPEGELWRITDYPSVHELDFDFGAEIRALEEQLAGAARARVVGDGEKAILVGLSVGRGRATAESSLAELAELANTAGVQVLESIVQLRREHDPKYLIGKGKLEEIVLKSMQLGADLIVFDKDLSPSQARHIAKETSLKVLDRTQLILDIFAQRAQSAEGKLQVELAQTRYLMPRLTAGTDAGLSRLMGGGVGGRGPGETKLEMDRRRARDRITFLEKKIEALSSSRAVRRKERNRRGIPVVSIVGYTNAGKSTLLNALTRSEVLAEDKLFATLDPTSRRLRFPRDREVIITDTVGFIRDLPKDLVAAFRATLEELEDADLLLHVVDVADPERDEHIAAVDRILESLGLAQTPKLLVFNKADKLAPEAKDGGAKVNDAILTSAITRRGFDDLLEKADALLWSEGATSRASAASGGLPARIG